MSESETPVGATEDGYLAWLIIMKAMCLQKAGGYASDQEVAEAIVAENSRLRQELDAVLKKLEEANSWLARSRYAHDRTVEQMEQEIARAQAPIMHRAEAAEARLAGERKRLIEACAKACENVYGGGCAHTYASENAHTYRTQDGTIASCAKAIRALSAQPKPAAAQGQPVPEVIVRERSNPGVTPVAVAPSLETLAAMRDDLTAGRGRISGVMREINAAAMQVEPSDDLTRAESRKRDSIGSAPAVAPNTLRVEDLPAHTEAQAGYPNQFGATPTPMPDEGPVMCITIDGQELPVAVVFRERYTALRAHAEGVQERLDAMTKLNRIHVQKLEQAEARLAEVEKDAERYRWLRDRRISGLGIPHLAHIVNQGGDVAFWQETTKSTDAAIDAALANQREKEK